MIGIAIVVGVVLLFVGATYLNGKTEVPESCRDLVLDECESCHSHSCSIGE
jgi:hypothetical protein